jgi:hypothetical protein
MPLCVGWHRAVRVETTWSGFDQGALPPVWSYGEALALTGSHSRTFFIFHIMFFILHIMFFIFHITFFLYPITFYYVFDEYSLVLVLNRISKKLKSVMKKLFGVKSRAGTADTLFQDCSTATSRRAEMMKHMDPSLVGRGVCFQRDEVIFLFSYHFAI